VYDTSDIDHPVQLERHNEDNVTYAEVARAPDRSRLYLLDKKGGLTIFSLSDTGTLSRIGSYPFGSSGIVLSHDGTQAYVTDGDNGLKVLDVHDPAHIRIVGELQ